MIAELLRQCRREGRLTEDAAAEAIRIARGVLARRGDVPFAVRDDVLGRFSEKLTEKWEQIDPDKYPKTYVQRMVWSCLMDRQRSFHRDLKKVSALSEAEDEEKVYNYKKWKTVETGAIRAKMGGTDFRSLDGDQLEELRSYARRLRLAGVLYRDIAATIGITIGLAWKWVHWRKSKRGRPRRS